MVLQSILSSKFLTFAFPMSHATPESYFLIIIYKANCFSLRILSTQCCSLESCCTKQWQLVLNDSCSSIVRVNCRLRQCQMPRMKVDETENRFSLYWSLTCPHSNVLLIGAQAFIRLFVNNSLTHKTYLYGR